jgi:hypothetical protein
MKASKGKIETIKAQMSCQPRYDGGRSRKAEANQRKMDIIQEKRKPGGGEDAINSLWSELEETIKNLAEDILSFIDQPLQGTEHED